MKLAKRYTFSMLVLLFSCATHKSHSVDSFPDNIARRPIIPVTVTTCLQITVSTTHWVPVRTPGMVRDITKLKMA